MNDSFTYPGDELALFQHAKNWKKYFAARILPYIHGRVLEAGAGIGGTTLLLNNSTASSWLMLEPDAGMSQLLETKIAAKEFPGNTALLTGTIDAVSGSFDTIIYIDVLEHIHDDGTELVKASALLNPGGHLIILSPAFGHLYSPFDKAIGHYRRYTKRIFRAITPPGTRIIHNRYYDTTGYFAGLINKLLLRQRYPSQQQVLFWDRWMIPVSRITDKLFFHCFGKAIIGIWKKIS